MNFRWAVSEELCGQEQDWLSKILYSPQLVVRGIKIYTSPIHGHQIHVCALPQLLGCVGEGVHKFGACGLQFDAS